jgi:hypothetical protein
MVGPYRITATDADPRCRHRPPLLVGEDRRVQVCGAGETCFHQALTGGRRDAHG